jgi:hypothetical protein
MNQNDIDNIDIQRIVVLDTDAAGDLYMERVFPLWVDVIVVTLEGKYPVNTLLRDRVLTEIQSNPNIYLLLYGAESEKMPSASLSRLLMSAFLNQDLRRYPWQTPIWNFDENKIISLSKAFCNIGRDSARLQSYNHYIDVMMPSSVGWYHDLIRS